MSSGNLEMNPDLAKERSHCPFPKEELTNLIDGGPDKTAERRRVEKMYFEHPEVRILFLKLALNLKLSCRQEAILYS